MMTRIFIFIRHNHTKDIFPKSNFTMHCIFFFMTACTTFIATIFHPYCANTALLMVGLAGDSLVAHTPHHHVAWYNLTSHVLGQHKWRASELA